MNASTEARLLRRNSTDAERLRNRRSGGWKFRRQSPIGPYIVDFVCIEQKLIVEVDGGHHQDRADWLDSQCFCVVRFWNNEVLTNTDEVTASILEALEHTQRGLLPLWEKGQASSLSKGEDEGEGESSPGNQARVTDANFRQDFN